jgi:hypothetical protein
MDELVILAIHHELSPTDALTEYHAGGEAGEAAARAPIPATLHQGRAVRTGPSDPSWAAVLPPRPDNLEDTPSIPGGLPFDLPGRTIWRIIPPLSEFCILCGLILTDLPGRTRESTSGIATLCFWGRARPSTTRVRSGCPPSASPGASGGGPLSPHSTRIPRSSTSSSRCIHTLGPRGMRASPRPEGSKGVHALLWAGQMCRGVGSAVSQRVYTITRSKWPCWRRLEQASPERLAEGLGEVHDFFTWPTNLSLGREEGQAIL